MIGLGTYIGFIHPRFEEWFTPCVEIGWRLKKEVWNRGLASEGAIACLKYGFETLGFERVYSFTSVLNKPSERVMQKAGMKHAGFFEHPALEEGQRLRKHTLYVLLKNF